MSEKKLLPTREEILSRMWELANAPAGDAVRMACFPGEAWGDVTDMRLDGVTEFKRGANGVIELRFVDRGRLLEHLLEACDQGGEEQMDRFLRAMEGDES